MKTEQKKIIKYVQSGALLKLKALLEKLKAERKKDFNLNFTMGERRRTPLHVACVLGDDAVVRCLLSHGAQADLKDSNKDTPVHIAAQYICDEGSYPDYKLLVEPLIRKNPNIMSFSNKNNETPMQILNQAKKRYKLLKKIQDEDEEVAFQQEQSTEDWNTKLSRETEAEYYEQTNEFAFGSGQSAEDEYKTYDEWADRIFAEYQRKNINASNRKRRKELQSRKRKKEWDDVTAHLLKRETEDYVRQVKRMREEVLTQKRERYERKMTSMRSEGEISKLRFRDIPWPCQGNAQEMVEVLLSAASTEASKSDRKRLIVRQLVLWHPDKFEQRCGDRLLEKDRSRILDTVKAIAQELNRSMESLKS